MATATGDGVAKLAALQHALALGALTQAQFDEAAAKLDHGPAVPAAREYGPRGGLKKAPAAASVRTATARLGTAAKGIVLGFQDDDQRTALVLSPNGTVALTPAEGCRKKAVTWCQKHCDPAAATATWDTYAPADFEPMRDHCLTRMDGTQRTSIAVPVLVSTRYVYRFVPARGEWRDGDGNLRNPFPGMLFSERGVSVLCTMVRSESRVQQRRVRTQDAEGGDEGWTLSSYNQWRHVVVTPLGDESDMPVAARTVRARLASLQASPYQVRVSPMLAGATALVRYLEEEHDPSRAQALLRHDRKTERDALECAGARAVSACTHASTAGTFVAAAQKRSAESFQGTDSAAATGKRQTMVGDEF